MPAPEAEYLTTEEVASICRTQPGTVRYWRHARKGPRGYKVGRRVLYRADEVRAWISAASEAPAA